jgi:hypothetical protein
LVEKFKEHGRVYSTGKVLKLRFPVPNNDPLRFFVFKDDVERLLNNKLFYARVYLDAEAESSDKNG